MSNITKTLLKNGITGLSRLEEDYFKENVTHVLTFKLNDAIEDAYQTASEKILQTKFVTESTPDLNEFVDFVSNFKEGKYQFKNGSVLNITESDVSSIKNLFEALGTKTREQMVREIFKDSATFQKHVEFYSQAKGLLR